MSEHYCDCGAVGNHYAEERDRIIHLLRKEFQAYPDLLARIIAVIETP